METRLFVSVDLEGRTHVVGTLWARASRGRESATFEYDPAWLENPGRFALEPALALGAGPLHTLPNRAVFGAIGDSAPDRWGRRLIQREERRRAREAKRPPRTLNEADYLLGVSDIARQGALRFSRTEGGPYLAEGGENDIPPLVRLPRLLDAAMAVDAGGDAVAADDDLRLLLAPGSSLGGARPKASVIDNDGTLSIAKFPKSDDTISVPAWEAVALGLAAKAGIDTPAWRLQTVAERPVLILRRFDRDGAVRIPFLSAMSLVGAADGEEHSYMEIADALRQHGAAPEADCAQLWRRIVFNILVSNTDDHLRNHGVLYRTRRGWRLAPAYDLNPMPVDLKPRFLTLAINEAENAASLDVALDVAKHFGVKPKDAHAIVKEVGEARAGWREEALGAGLSRSEIKRMASAFEHEDSAAAAAL
ncbi:MAG: type II toxin-antitoxin system HipA family toxin [Alphaproteobacteria bacterium]|nr:type II toxin-antitoxin system HipA family toxin [Alphaproteobacteria bacterium]